MVLSRITLTHTDKPHCICLPEALPAKFKSQHDKIVSAYSIVQENYNIVVEILAVW